MSAMPLLWRLFAAHAAVVVTAVVVLVATPARVSGRTTGAEIAVLLVAAAAALAIELAVLRRALRPLDDLRAAMADVHLPNPGARIAVTDSTAEVDELADAFNDMFARLDRERRDSGRRAIAAQEAERRRIGLELHDEIGQLLTGVLLQLKPAPGSEPDPRLARAQAGVHQALDAIREITRGLRPDALDDLGLRSALTALASAAADGTALHVTRAIDRGLPPLPEDVELAIYRVAQESLTNVLRHAGAREAELRLGCVDGRVRLTVTDDGVGLPAVPNAAGNGLIGMAERAAAIGAALTTGPRPDGRPGTQVALEVAS